MAGLLKRVRHKLYSWAKGEAEADLRYTPSPRLMFSSLTVFGPDNSRHYYFRESNQFGSWIEEVHVPAY